MSGYADKSKIEGSNRPMGDVQDTKQQEALYKKNLDALAKRHPHLVEIIEAADSTEEGVTVSLSDSGDQRLLFRKENGEEIYIHSSEDPVKCANQAIDLLGAMEKEGIAVLFGFGLGYFAEEILKKFEKGHILMVYEATPLLFKTALRVRDLTQLLESDKVFIILGKDADDFSTLHRHHQLIANGKFWVVKHHPSVKLNEDAYEKFFKRLQDEKISVDMNTNTGINLGKEFMGAFMANIPTLIRKPGVAKLRDIFKGRPAIIVSAGPSLDTNVHLLREAKGKAIIIAVDAALPTLLPCRIIPDVVVAIDPLKKVSNMYRDNPLLKQVPLICLSQYQPEVVLMYPGPVFINSMPQSIVHQWFSSFWEEKGYISCAGGSVAHLAFGTAEYFGCDTIAFVGQDLSFATRSHSRGFADISDEIEEEAIQKGLSDMHIEMRGTFPTKNIFGETVLTRGDFLSFKTTFENIMRRFQGKAFNATEGGLPIEGVISTRFVDYIDEHCRNLPELGTFSVLSSLYDDEVRYSLDDLLSLGATVKDEFKKIKQTSRRILNYIARVHDIRQSGQKDSKELHRILDKIEPLIEKAKSPVLNFLATYEYGFELHLEKYAVKEIDEIEDEWERLDKQLERGQNYYSTIISLIGSFMKPWDNLIDALQREAKVNSILKDASLSEYERYLKAGMLYKKSGCITQAVKYLELAGGKVEEAERMSSINLPLAEMYLKQSRFYEARDLLNKIIGHRASSRMLRQKSSGLLGTCKEMIALWEEKEKNMGRLLKDAEASYGSHLESGYFYFRLKDYERAEKAYTKAVDEWKAAENKIKLSAAFYGLAHVYLATDAPEKAVEALEKAIAADPQNPLLYRDLGFIAFQNNNMAEAELFFTRAIELAPQTIELYKLLADLYLSLGELGKAAALYEDALLVNPGNPVIQQDLSIIYKEIIAKTGRVNG